MTVLKFTLAGATALTLTLGPAAAHGTGARVEVQTVRIVTPSDAIGTPDYAIDSLTATPSLQARN